MRTSEQKAQMIENLSRLRRSLPEHNMFGDANWIPIDAQIAVIKGEATVDDYRGDDHESVAEVAAQEAQDWLEGEIEDNELCDPDDINDDEDESKQERHNESPGE
jgi:hypothetical protein